MEPEDNTFMTGLLSPYHSNSITMKVLNQPFYDELEESHEFDQRFEQKIQTRQTNFQKNLDSVLEIRMNALQGQLVAKHSYFKTGAQPVAGVASKTVTKQLVEHSPLKLVPANYKITSFGSTERFVEKREVHASLAAGTPSLSTILPSAPGFVAYRSAQQTQDKDRGIVINPELSTAILGLAQASEQIADMRRALRPFIKKPQSADASWDGQFAPCMSADQEKLNGLDFGRKSLQAYRTDGAQNRGQGYHPVTDQSEQFLGPGSYNTAGLQAHVNTPALAPKLHERRKNGSETLPLPSRARGGGAKLSTLKANCGVDLRRQPLLRRAQFIDIPHDPAGPQSLNPSSSARRANARNDSLPGPCSRAVTTRQTPRDGIAKPAAINNNTGVSIPQAPRYPEPPAPKPMSDRMAWHSLNQVMVAVTAGLDPAKLQPESHHTIYPGKSRTQVHSLMQLLGSVDTEIARNEQLAQQSVRRALGSEEPTEDADLPVTVRRALTARLPMPPETARVALSRSNATTFISKSEAPRVDSTPASQPVGTGPSAEVVAGFRSWQRRYSPAQQRQHLANLSLIQRVYSGEEHEDWQDYMGERKARGVQGRLLARERQEEREEKIREIIKRKAQMGMKVAKFWLTLVALAPRLRRLSTALDCNRKWRAVIIIQRAYRKYRTFVAKKVKACSKLQRVWRRVAILKITNKKQLSGLTLARFFSDVMNQVQLVREVRIQYVSRAVVLGYRRFKQNIMRAQALLRKWLKRKRLMLVLVGMQWNFTMSLRLKRLPPEHPLQKNKPLLKQLARIKLPPTHVSPRSKRRALRRLVVEQAHRQHQLVKKWQLALDKYVAQKQNGLEAARRQLLTGILGSTNALILSR